MAGHCDAELGAPGTIQARVVYQASVVLVSADHLTPPGHAVERAVGDARTRGTAMMCEVCTLVLEMKETMSVTKAPVPLQGGPSAALIAPAGGPAWASFPAQEHRAEAGDGVPVFQADHRSVRRGLG